MTKTYAPFYSQSCAGVFLGFFFALLLFYFPTFFDSKYFTVFLFIVGIVHMSVVSCGRIITMKLISLPQTPFPTQVKDMKMLAIILNKYNS